MFPKTKSILISLRSWLAWGTPVLETSHTQLPMLSNPPLLASERFAVPRPPQQSESNSPPTFEPTVVALRACGFSSGGFACDWIDTRQGHLDCISDNILVLFCCLRLEWLFLHLNCISDNVLVLFCRLRLLSLKTIYFGTSTLRIAPCGSNFAPQSLLVSLEYSCCSSQVPNRDSFGLLLQSLDIYI